MPRREPPGTVATNRRARHDYEILETFEADLARQRGQDPARGQGVAPDAYAVVDGGDIVLHMQIPAYSHTGYEGHEPTRPRKLLLHRKQIDQLAARINERGLTLVPLRIYFKGQLVKVELGLARGKRAYDKRQSLAKRDAERDGPGPQGQPAPAARRAAGSCRGCGAGTRPGSIGGCPATAGSRRR